MPKERKPSSTLHSSRTIPYKSSRPDESKTAKPWDPEDDKILLEARATGLNWDALARRYFPDKSGNACRKHFERLNDRRRSDEWDTNRLGELATHYMILRQEMWERLASVLGMPDWRLIEAKCMEKGLKTLSAASKAARGESAVVMVCPGEEPGIPENNSDSGIGICSDTELEVGPSNEASNSSSSRPTQGHVQRPTPQPTRSLSLPQPLQPLPLYEPPAPVQSTKDRGQVTASSAAATVESRKGGTRYSFGSQHIRPDMSIQSVLAPIGPNQQ